MIGGTEKDIRRRPKQALKDLDDDDDALFEDTL